MPYDPVEEHAEYEKRKPYYRDYYAHKKERSLLYQKEYDKSHPTVRMCKKARARAKEQGIPFAITSKDIVIPECCPVLGIPLFFTPGKLTDNTPTLDRIVPSLGYVKGNIAVLSCRANRLKQDATVEDVLKLLAWLIRVTS